MLCARLSIWTNFSRTSCNSARLGPAGAAGCCGAGCCGGALCCTCGCCAGACCCGVTCGDAGRGCGETATRALSRGGLITGCCGVGVCTGACGADTAGC